MKKEPIRLQKGQATVLIYPPNNTPEEQERILQEIKRVNLEIWREINEEPNDAVITDEQKKVSNQ